MSVILFYAPFNRRSRDTESLMIAFRKQGHRVLFLSQADGTEIKNVLKRYDVECYSYEVKHRMGWIWSFQHIWYFVRFCRANRVEVVYSHLEPANFVATAGQFFINARVFICRHHLDEIALKHADKSLAYRLTYRWAKTVIVVSDHARRYMIEQEGIDADKIVHIDLAYNFDLFAKPDARAAAVIRSEHQCELLLLMACRLTPSKRPAQCVSLVGKLRAEGIDVKLIVLGDGELMNELRLQSVSSGLANQIQFMGLVGNVFDYLEACDILVHPSASESSCVIVKEAGLVGKPVVVCRGVGDFDEYLRHEENALLTDLDGFVDQAALLIRNKMRHPSFRFRLGAMLGVTVREKFSVDYIIDRYRVFNQAK